MSGPPFEHWPLPGRPALRWPDEARVAVWVGVNIELYEWGKPSISIEERLAALFPDPMNYGWRDYGARVGIWRIFDALERVGAPGTAIINSEACVQYPELVAACRERGWGWVAHGRTNSVLHTDMAEDVERAYLAEVVETITAQAGAAPGGWLGPGLTETLNTPRLLGELGLRYVCDWCNDDQPYPLRGTEARMVSVPYSIEVNDIPLFVGKGISGADFERTLVDQFDRLYAESAESGRVMAIPLHPFLIGLPFRIGYLERALEHIASHEGVWWTTSDAIADWYLGNCYDEAVASVAAYASKRSGRMASAS